MNAHLRIGDNRTFALKQAVLLYQDGSRAFATLHEVKHRPNEAPYLCAGQSVTTGFLETLAKGLGASMAAEVLPEHVLARTPDVIAWWRLRPFAMKSPLQAQSRSSTLEFLSMKSKTFCLSLRPIVRQAASFYRSSRMSEEDRSRLYMAATLDCFARRACSTESLAKVKVGTLPTGGL
jgi:hypothetical protein